jgi:recombination protein RecA
LAFPKRPEAPPQPKAVIEAPTTEVEKFKRLFALSKALDKKHATTNSLIRMGDRVDVEIAHIPTGMPSLDNEVLGCGGIPRGRIIEIFGPESAGKTTATLHIVGREQKQGGLAAFVDAEHALDLNYADSLGVDVDKLLISQPNSGEQALDTTLELVKSKCVSIIVVDSVAALVPEAELAGEIGDAHVGLQARLMSQAMRMLRGECNVNGVTVIFINQIREKIGVMFGSPETTTGGRALKFYSSIRLDVRRRKVIGPEEAPIGHQLEIKAVKNKCGKPFRSTIVDLMYPGTQLEPGFDLIGDTISYASKKNIFEMNGSWYSLDLNRKDPKTEKPLGVERLANGLANLKSFLKSDPDALKVVLGKLAKQLADEKAAAKKESV